MEESVSRITLARLYNNALDWFDYVQPSPRLDSGFQEAQLKLDSARMSLSRWGEAVGLSGHVESFPIAELPTNDLLEAENVLGDILESFSTAARGCHLQEFGKETYIDEHQEMDSLGRALHHKMRAVAANRRNNIKPVLKERWTLNETHRMKEFMEDVTGQICSLVNTFPSSQRIQRELCQREISEIGTNEGLRMLLGIAATHDKQLEEAISKHLKAQESGANTWTNNNFRFDNNKQILGGAGNHSFNTFSNFHSTF